MKKLVKKSSFLVVLMAVMMFALPGCSSNNNGKEPANSTPPTSTPVVSATPEQSTTPEASEPAVMKSITVEVVNAKGETKTYQIKSDAANLYEAIKSSNDLKLDGDFGDYGFYITAVNGEAADFDKDKAYWAFYVNGEYGQTSVDTQPIADGDTFKLAYEISKSE